MKHKDSLFLTTNIATESNMIDYVSKEYNAMDWPRFFFGWINQVYRGFMVKSQTKIENVGIFTALFTGKATTFGQINNIVSNALPTGNLITQIANAGLMLYSIKHGEAAAFKSSLPDIIKNNGNPYYKYVMCYKKIKFTDEELIEAKNGVKILRAAFDLIKKEVCTPIEGGFREMTLGEKNAFKLYRPNDIGRELKAAMDNAEKSGHNEWISVYTQLGNITKEILAFVDSNTRGEFKH